MTLPTISSFWHGPMTWLEQLSIASFIRHGHRVEVYTYGAVDNFPTGAVRRDAAEILPADQLVFYKGEGTPGVFSDHFRLRLLQQGRALYSDLDVYCIRPFSNLLDYVMGFERPGSVNNAVLAIPANAPLLDDLLSVFDPAHRPLLEPHLPFVRRLEVAVSRLLGNLVPPEYMQFGATGPFALTHYAKERGVLGKVMPQSVFYPIPYGDIPALVSPGSSVDAAIRPDTLAIHLWRSQLTDRGRAELPVPAPGSALAELCAREGIAI